MASTSKTIAELISSDLSVDVANTDIVGVITGDQLAPSGVTPGVYGGASAIGALCIDDKGRITSASNVAVTTGLPPFTICGPYTSPTTWTKPASLDYVYVNLTSAGGGGGGGGGKAPGGAPGSSGNPGGTTSFGAFASVTGGQGGAGGPGSNTGTAPSGAAGAFSAGTTDSQPYCTLMASSPGFKMYRAGPDLMLIGAGGTGGNGARAGENMESLFCTGGKGGCGGAGSWGSGKLTAPQIPGPVAITIGARGNGGAGNNGGSGPGLSVAAQTGGPGTSGSPNNGGQILIVQYEN